VVIIGDARCVGSWRQESGAQSRHFLGPATQRRQDSFSSSHSVTEEHLEVAADSQWWGWVSRPPRIPLVVESLALAAAETVVPAQPLLSIAGASGAGPHQLRTPGSMGLAEGVAAGNQGTVSSSFIAMRQRFRDIATEATGSARHLGPSGFT